MEGRPSTRRYRREYDRGLSREERPLGPVFGNDARQVIAFGAGRYAFMSARSMMKPDTNAGKPSLTPLH
jgi:hypothetical protein